MPRTLVLDGPRQLRLSDMPTRPLRPGEIRLRSLLSGISHGTELSLYRGTSAFTDKVFDRGLRAFVEPPAGSVAAYPVTLGYEMVAEVTEVGPDVTEVAVGDLVHTGTPHQEETVLDLDAPCGPPTRWCGSRPPSVPSGPCSSAWPRSPCRPSTTPR
jgi:threonine dehydrogenase-like Zn-dependent dehydrogenase